MTFTNNQFSVARSYGTKEEVITESFEGIAIEGKSTDVVIGFSEDDKCHVIYPASDDRTFDIGVQDGTLTVTEQREGISLFSWGLHDIKLQVLLPEEAYESLGLTAGSADVTVVNGLLFDTAKIETGSGDIDMRADVTQSLEVKVNSGHVEVKGLSRGTAAITTGSGEVNAENIQNDGLAIEVRSGDIEMSGVQSRTLSVKTGSGDLKAEDLGGSDMSLVTGSGSIRIAGVRTDTLNCGTNSGNIRMSDVTAQGQMTLKTGSGEIKAEACDAGSIDAQTNSGDVKMELLSGKLFDVDTNSGDTNIPASDREGGDCRIRTGSGDVKITVREN